MSDSFTAQDERALRGELRKGRVPPCPRCGGKLEVSPIPAPESVAYVRDRVLVRCPSCGARAVVDRE
jgi:hypothetical protein